MPERQERPCVLHKVVFCVGLFALAPIVGSQFLSFVGAGSQYEMKPEVAAQRGLLLCAATLVSAVPAACFTQVCDQRVLLRAILTCSLIGMVVASFVNFNFVSQNGDGCFESGTCSVEWDTHFAANVWAGVAAIAAVLLTGDAIHRWFKKFAGTSTEGAGGSAGAENHETAVLVGDDNSRRALLLNEPVEQNPS